MESERAIAARRQLRCGALMGLFVAFLAVSTAQLAAGADMPERVLPAKGCLPVSGARVLAGELARQDVRFQSLAPETDLGYVPAPGESRQVPVPMRGEDPEGQFVSRICIVRAMRPLTQAAIQAALDLPATGLPIAEVKAWQEGDFPEGVIRMPRKGIVHPAKGSHEVLWRGAVEYENGRTAPFWARVTLRRERSCGRWIRAVRRGQPVNAEAIEQSPCDAAAVIAEVLPGQVDEAVLTGHQLARDVSAGAWLEQSQLTRKPTLQRGDRAALVVRRGSVRLSLPVVAEQAGAVGESIWVRSVRTGQASGSQGSSQRVRAVVESRDSVRLDAQATEAERH